MIGYIDRDAWNTAESSDDATALLSPPQLVSGPALITDKRRPAKRLDPANLTVTEAAERLSTSADQVRALIASKRLYASNISIGRKPRWRIASKDIDAFLAGGKTEQPTRTRPTKAKANYREYV